MPGLPTLPIMIGLAIWAAIGPLTTYAFASVKASWERSEAVAKADADARADERRKMQAELANAAREATRAAEEAEAKVEATPADQSAIKSLCEKSASCRDRKGKGGKS